MMCWADMGILSKLCDPAEDHYRQRQLNSLDAPGSCEAALRAAIQSRNSLNVRVAILRVGEQRMLIGRDHSSYPRVDADHRLPRSTSVGDDSHPAVNSTMDTPAEPFF